MAIVDSNGSIGTHLIQLEARSETHVKAARRSHSISAGINILAFRQLRIYIHSGAGKHILSPGGHIKGGWKRGVEEVPVGDETIEKGPEGEI